MNYEEFKQKLNTLDKLDFNKGVSLSDDGFTRYWILIKKEQNEYRWYATEPVTNGINNKPMARDFKGSFIAVRTQDTKEKTWKRKRKSLEEIYENLKRQNDKLIEEAEAEAEEVTLLEEASSVEEVTPAEDVTEYSNGYMNLCRNSKYADMTHFKVLISNVMWKVKPPKDNQNLQKAIFSKIKYSMKSYTLAIPQIADALQNGCTIKVSSEEVNPSLLWLDFDDISKDLLDTYISQFKEQLGAMPVIVCQSFSGKGYHVAYAFERPLTLEEYETVYKFIAHLTPYCQYLDWRCYNTGRLMFGTKTDHLVEVISNDFISNSAIDGLLRTAEANKPNIDRYYSSVQNAGNSEAGASKIHLDDIKDYAEITSKYCADDYYSIIEYLKNIDIDSLLATFYPDYWSDHEVMGDGQICLRCPIHDGGDKNFKTLKYQGQYVNAYKCFSVCGGVVYDSEALLSIRYKTKDVLALYMLYCKEFGVEATLVKEKTLKPNNAKKLRNKKGTGEEAGDDEDANKSNGKKSSHKKSWKVMTQTEYIKTAKSDPPPIIPSIYYHGGLSLLTGYEGMGKTILALKMAWSIAEGKMIFDNVEENDPVFKCAAKQNVLYISFEGHIKGKCESYGIVKSDHLFQLILESQHDMPDLLNKDDLDNLIELCKENDITVVFIDPFYLSVSPEDYTNPKRMADLTKDLNDLYEKEGITIICNHHNTLSADGNKENSPKAAGSSVIAWGAGDQWTMLELPRELKEEAEDIQEKAKLEGKCPPQFCMLKCKKVRYGDHKISNIIIEFDREGGKINQFPYIKDKTSLLNSRRNGSSEKALYGIAVEILIQYKSRGQLEVTKKQFVQDLIRQLAYANFPITEDTLLNHYTKQLYDDLTKNNYIEGINRNKFKIIY